MENLGKTQIEQSRKIVKTRGTYSTVWTKLSNGTDCNIDDLERNGILLPKLLRPTMRKNCSSNPDFFLKFEAEGQEFTKFLKSLEQFTQTVEGQNNFW